MSQIAIHFVELNVVSFQQASDRIMPQETAHQSSLIFQTSLGAYGRGVKTETAEHPVYPSPLRSSHHSLGLAPNCIGLHVAATVAGCAAVPAERILVHLYVTPSLIAVQGNMGW
ncbi:hypothetical protein NL676_029037 [Syzygium grande]|nr:hypothetical protein NL676_029037 [Syzygium grande]